MFFIFPYFLYANSILSLASIPKTCAFEFDENNFALLPTPVPASRIVERVFKKLLNFEKNTKQVFSIVKNYEFYQLLESDLSKNKFFKLKLINDND